MLLTIDVGNTETKLGIFADESDALEHAWRITTERRRTADENRVLIAQLCSTAGIDVRTIHAVAIASVVPQQDTEIEAACRRLFGVAPEVLKAHRQPLIPVRTERPSEVGADLIAVAIGAKARFGAPLIIVSYGTATVFAALSSACEYIGVAIAPGINISIDALTERAAKLPQIALEKPGPALGRTTMEALQSGIVYGFVGQTEALIARFRSEMGVQAKVVATGGLADIVARQTDVIDAVEPHLSLIGLQLYHASLLR